MTQKAQMQTTKSRQGTLKRQAKIYDKMRLQERHILENWQQTELGFAIIPVLPNKKN